MVGDNDTTPAGQQPPRRLPSRRSFLQGTAWAAAGAAAGIGIGSQLPRDTGPARPAHQEGKALDHLVVIMFENRSFDNLLGYLYTPDAPAPRGQGFEGLASGRHSNPGPDGSPVFAHPYSGPTDTVMSSPDPDPGEEYPHVNTQLFGTVDPPENATRASKDMGSPYNAPADPSRPSMSGFVADYVNDYRSQHGGAMPSAQEFEVIMGSFTPEMLPVFSALARQFAVYDGWHCAVPSQTFCNRSFFHASTSHGFVINKGEGGFEKWLDPALNSAPTIFNRLQDAGLSWAVYFDDQQLISVTGLIHATVLQPYWKTNFRTMTQFHEDAASGNLPAYSFIEPRMIFNHNDMHPPAGRLSVEEIDEDPVASSAISDVRAGEALLHDVYDAVRLSASPSGSNAYNTMLLVTFDEHGGTYDHLPPPAATPPDATAGVGEMGFGFDRLGVRVPALAISAYTAAGTVISEPMHHGAVISTLCRQYDLPHLSERDRGAADVTNSINLSVARPPSSWPVTTPLYLPANPEAAESVPEGQDDHVLTSPGISLIALLLAKYGQPGDPVPRTFREAHELLEKHGRGLFGAPS